MDILDENRSLTLQSIDTKSFVKSGIVFSKMDMGVGEELRKFDGMG
jgi:hypothetical protein